MVDVVTAKAVLRLFGWNKLESVYDNLLFIWQTLRIYVAPQIGINTKPVWGATRFGISPQTDMGIPIPVWGLAFFKFFQTRTKSAFSHRKFRQSQRHGAPLLAENLGNQHTAPAIQELDEQEKGRLLLTSLKVLSSQVDNSTANNFSYLHFWLRSPI